MLLDFNDRMGTGVSTWLWPKDFLSSIIEKEDNESKEREPDCKKKTYFPNLARLAASFD